MMRLWEDCISAFNEGVLVLKSGRSTLIFATTYYYKKEINLGFERLEMQLKISKYAGHFYCLGQHCLLLEILSDAQKSSLELQKRKLCKIVRQGNMNGLNQ